MKSLREKRRELELNIRGLNKDEEKE